MNLQQHLEVQASAQQWADDFMRQYNISATEMVDALSKVLLNLKDKAIVEYLIAVAAAQQEAAQPQVMEGEEDAGRTNID